MARPEPPTKTLDDIVEKSLDSVLSHTTPDLPNGLRLASRLAQTLVGLYAARLIHHDLRQANVVMQEVNGELHLTDLRVTRARTRRTVPDGHPQEVDWAYLSPEQTGRMNRPVDYRTDFYSLGVLLYRLLAGQLPLQANDPLEWAHCHVARLPPPLHEIAPAMPRQVLYRLARIGNMAEILEQADRLVQLDDRYRPFADRLRSLAKGYESKALLQLVEQHRQISFASNAGR